jgi:2-dehydro-3-deoxyphosphogluconate aldolase / (4S)-4-hydroxy-2-oxoglutarate aldolase
MHHTIQQIIDTRLLPLFYSDHYDTCKKNIVACYEAGVKVFEFTNRGPFAIENFSKLKSEFSKSHQDLKFGVGTVYTVEEAKTFIDLGADFIVQPVCVESVAKHCQNVNIPWIPGTMTLNEIYHAHLLGASLIKVFPANILGTSYIKNIRGPLPQANLMVTGGIEANVDEIKQWLNAGAKVCGLGSQLFTYTSEEITKKLSLILEAL